MNPKDRNHPSNTDSQAPEPTELDKLRQMKHLLRQAMPPLSSDQLEPRTDLWPQLRTRLESQSPANRAVKSLRRGDSITTRVPWFDWALAALAAATLLLFPGIIPALLYHF